MLFILICIVGIFFIIKHKRANRVTPSPIYTQLPEDLPRLNLQPDPIPYAMHYKNVRSAVDTRQWISIKYQEMGGNSVMRRTKCEVCSAKEALECHEVWDFLPGRVQKLIGLRLLCHKCHMVCHIGYVLRKNDNESIGVYNHFKKINNIDDATADRYINAMRAKAKKLNEYSEITKSRRHILDLTYLNQMKYNKCKLPVFKKDSYYICKKNIKL